MTRHRLAAALLALAALLAVPSVPASAAIASGSSMQTVTFRGTPIDLYLYKPSCSNPSLFFMHHGSARNASGARDAAITIANRKCWVVVAPLFDEARFPGSWAYQQGGMTQSNLTTIRAYDTWNVHYQPEMIAWARAQEGRPDMPFYVFGHSAGGQWVSRVIGTVSFPAGAVRLVAGNPSSHMLASINDSTLYDRVAYGYTGMASAQNPEAMRQAALASPVTIYLGTEDNDPNDPELSQATGAVAQGEHRLARGEFAFDVGRRKAQEKGWFFNWRLTYASGIGHSSSGLLNHAMADTAFAPAPTTPGGGGTNTPCGVMQ